MIKILAIDDNHDNLIVLQALLSDAFPDSRIIMVQSGVEGIFMAKTENPDVILLDLVMPGVDGFETCRRLKQDSFLRRIPVIILTAAKTETSYRVRALKIGAEAFLSKPIDESELTAQVSSMIRIKKSEDAVRLENRRLEEVVRERTDELLRELEDKKNTEEQLKKSFSELEEGRKATLSLLEDLKIEIEERQKIQNELVEAKEKAEASDRLKTAFLNNISHEVRTPLNGILGFGELITDPDLTDETKKMYLAVLNASSDRLLKTINDFMDISLIVSGNMEVRNSIFNFGDLLERICLDMKELLMAKNMVVNIKKPELRPLILGSDEALVQKVLINLLDNAIKYSNNGCIDMGYHQDKEVVRVYVKDPGIGISKEKHEQIFERFVQEDPSNTRRYEGSGLGLSISKGVVELLGGKIGVESEKGIGSTFWFTLPLNEKK